MFVQEELILRAYLLVLFSATLWCFQLFWVRSGESRGTLPKIAVEMNPELRKEQEEELRSYLCALVDMHWS